MIRVLLMIAVAGFVLSVGAISAAVALGGPDAIARGGWHIASGRDWNWDDDDDTPKDWGAEATRTIDWPDADHLDVSLAADVRYIQQAGPATVTVTGPARLIDHVIVRGGTLKYEDRGHHDHHEKLTVVIRAPSISSFDVGGRSVLVVEGYNQRRLRIEASRSAEVVVTGEAGRLDLELRGSADADLSKLKVRDVDADVSGSADATIAPTEVADLEVSGKGDIRLLTQPKTLSTDISRSGRVRQVDPSTVAPSPTPTPSPSPSPKGTKG